jgi:hypothetical protein
MCFAWTGPPRPAVRETACPSDGANSPVRIVRPRSPAGVARAAVPLHNSKHSSCLPVPVPVPVPVDQALGGPISATHATQATCQIARHAGLGDAILRAEHATCQARHGAWRKVSTLGRGGLCPHAPFNIQFTAKGSTEVPMASPFLSSPEAECSSKPQLPKTNHIPSCPSVMTAASLKPQPPLPTHLRSAP